MLLILNGSSVFLHTIRTTIKAWMSLNFAKIPSHLFYFGVRNVVTTLVLSILNGSSSFLHTIRTTIKAWMSLNFGKIPLLTLELAALERQKINE